MSNYSGKMIKQFRKIVAIISIVILMSLAYPTLTLANTDHILDNIEALSPSSQSIIEKRINEFEQANNLDLRVATIVKPEEENLLTNAKRLSKEYNDNGYLILVATQLPQKNE